MTNEYNKYAESNNKLIHLISAINGEFTLCGDAFEGLGCSDIELDPAAWKETKKRLITCEKCIREIQNCRGVRIK